jgi:Kelch motif
MLISVLVSSSAQARGGAGFASAGDCLYVIGGFNGNELGDMHAFDTAAGSWKQLDLAGAAQRLPPRSVAGIAAAADAGHSFILLLPHLSWNICSGLPAGPDQAGLLQRPSRAAAGLQQA